MKMFAMMRFTLFEAIRRGTLIFYFAVGTIIIAVFAVWLKRSPNDPSMIVLFGNTIPGTINGVSSANFFLVTLLKQSTFWIIVLGTFGAAGLMTSFLDKGIVELYLSKPFNRWELFVSRALGASVGVAANLMYCIVGLWLVFGLKLGVWHFGFLVAGLLVSYAFICYFSLVSFVAVWSRNAILAIVFGLFFSFVSIGLESREQGLYRLWDNTIYHRVLDGFYYITPQLDGMLTNASRLIGQIPFSPEQAVFTPAPYLYSLGAAALFYGLSIYYFSSQDF
jgi:ABC-type transport system involved in multi-copper enzyme maturation permease subunit